MTKLLSTVEVGAILGVTRETITDYIASGALAAAKIGRKWRVRTEDLDQFIRSHQAARSR